MAAHHVLWLLLVTSFDVTTAAAQTRPTTVPAGEVTAKKLLALIPGDLANDPRARSFDLAGAVRAEGLGYRFRVAQRGPGDGMLYIENLDDVPVFLFSGVEALMFDPARGRLRHMTGAAAKFELHEGGNGPTLSVGLTTDQGEPRDRLLTVKVDLRSIAAGFPNPRVEPLGGRRYVVRTAAVDGKFARFDFDLDAPTPLVGFQITNPGDPVGVLLVERVAVGEPIDRALFRFPDRAQMGRVAPRVVHRPARDEAEFGEHMDVVTQAILFHVALATPGQRREFERHFGPVDWEERRREVDRLTGPLRELFGPRHPHVSATSLPATHPASPPRGG